MQHLLLFIVRIAVVGAVRLELHVDGPRDQVSFGGWVHPYVFVYELGRLLQLDGRVAVRKGSGVRIKRRFGLACTQIPVLEIHSAFIRRLLVSIWSHSVCSICNITSIALRLLCRNDVVSGGQYVEDGVDLEFLLS